jgi:tetratricopeptide (TPR) repeat protein
LRAQVEINPANVTARRDLASIYLDVLRPRAALKLIQEALGRTPNDAELLYLSGLALERAGSHADALVPLVRAVEVDPRVRFGEPYLVAGDALSALGRHAEAQDAYERYVDSNSSDVVGYVRLARALSRLGERKDAEKQLAEGGATWASLPGWRKRRAFWRGYFGLFWTRVWWLRQPSAIAFSLMFVAILAGLAHAAWPLAAHALSESRARVPISQFYGDRVTYRSSPARCRRSSSLATAGAAGRPSPRPGGRSSWPRCRSPWIRIACSCSRSQRTGASSWSTTSSCP